MRGALRHVLLEMNRCITPDAGFNNKVGDNDLRLRGARGLLGLRVTTAELFSNAP
jgi:hypothetical protein